MSVRAIVFDFNGTLSDDEPVLCEVYRELFAEYGKPLSTQEYYDHLAGHSEIEIMTRWLGADFADIEGAIRERIARYRARVSDGSTVHDHVREAVRYAAGRVPVAVVSGAAREEIEPVVAAAGLAPLLRGIVADDDVAEGKPHPEGYLRALELLDGAAPAEVLALEDTEAGVASAKAAGLRVFAKRGTLDPHRLMWADEIVDEIDVALMRRVLG